MTGQNRIGNDVLGTELYDYDLVWKATAKGSLVLACIKKVQVKYDRSNPAWSHYAKNNVPKRIHGIEDKILYVTASAKTINQPLVNSSTFREHWMYSVLKVTDSYVLNSQVAYELVEKARKIKR